MIRSVDGKLTRYLMKYFSPSRCFMIQKVLLYSIHSSSLCFEPSSTLGGSNVDFCLLFMGTSWPLMWWSSLAWTHSVNSSCPVPAIIRYSKCQWTLCLQYDLWGLTKSREMSFSRFWKLFLDQLFTLFQMSYSMLRLAELRWTCLLVSLVFMNLSSIGTYCSK